MDFGSIGSLLASLFSNRGMMAAGTALSAYGSYTQGRAGASAANYNAGMAANGAAISAQQGDFAANQTFNRGRRVIGQGIANYGASGVTMDGSPLDVLADSTRNVISDTLMSRVPYASREVGLDSEANLDRNQARGASTSSYFQIGTDLGKGALRLRAGGPYFNFAASGDV